GQEGVASGRDDASDKKSERAVPRVAERHARLDGRIGGGRWLPKCGKRAAGAHGRRIRQRREERLASTFEPDVRIGDPWSPGEPDADPRIDKSDNSADQAGGSEQWKDEVRRPHLREDEDRQAEDREGEECDVDR